MGSGPRLAVLALLLVAARSLAAPTFVTSAADATSPFSVTLTVPAGDTLIVAVRGRPAFFPALLNDSLGATFVAAGTPVTGNGSLNNTATQLFYTSVFTGGSRTITLTGAGSTNGASLVVFQFSGVRVDYYWYSSYFANAGPADGRTVVAGADAVVFAQVLLGGSLVDAGTDLLPLPSTGADYYGWRPTPTAGSYPVLLSVTGAWIATVLAVGPTPDAGPPDAGPPDAGPPDGGSGDGGSGDGGATDAGLDDGGGPADGGTTDGGSGSTQDLHVGCDCSSGPAALGVLGLLWVLGRLRRRRA